MIDEAGARMRIQAIWCCPMRSQELDDKLRALRAEKDAAIAESGFRGVPLEVRDQRGKALREERKKAQVEMAQGQDASNDRQRDRRGTISLMWFRSTTGVPVSNLTEAETEKLLRMESVLHERVIGQEEAVNGAFEGYSSQPFAGSRIQSARHGFVHLPRPLRRGQDRTLENACRVPVQFAGCTHFASICRNTWRSTRCRRLIGSPPGYVGYDEGGQLTTAVRQRPYSVVLFDEIEKAHPDVFNILLQILEEGRLTDAQGRMVDFRNTVIIMTSNVGAREITTTAPLGFSSSGATGLNDDEIKTRVMSEVKRLFRPEFLNRIDEIIVFKSLTEDEIVEIVNLMVADLRDRLIEQNMTINMSDAANRLIAKEGTDLSFGARPLRRAIQRLLEDPISEQILEGKWTSGSVIDVDVEDEKLVFNQGTGSIPAPRKRDTIAQEAELILSNYDLGRAGLTYSGSGRGGSSGDSAAD